MVVETPLADSRSRTIPLQPEVVVQVRRQHIRVRVRDHRVASKQIFMMHLSISPEQHRSATRPDSQLLPHSRPGRASQVGLLLHQLSRRASDAAGIPRPLVLKVVFPPPSPAVVAIPVLVSGRDGSASIAFDLDEICPSSSYSSNRV